MRGFVRNLKYERLICTWRECKMNQVTLNEITIFLYNRYQFKRSTLLFPPPTSSFCIIKAICRAGVTCIHICSLPFPAFSPCRANNSTNFEINTCWSTVVSVPRNDPRWNTNSFTRIVFPSSKVVVSMGTVEQLLAPEVL